ncbi:hypothetical protein TRFO_05321 [Tritrichomonas foetus]|uniref:Uncharacterized protein n=1 Tax=Tritrichomonas foetus TaxID=1144522 RepID=A0A1J4K804_9EUKA|nr:hypothetical protein TRFO_05321 [Tritrichomonas foetus]|eukprot:OHT07098.1 hypothetical protein TRFO_05321 [Tritrichomonas foetus]
MFDDDDILGSLNEVEKDTSLDDINTFLPSATKARTSKQKSRRRPPMRTNLLASLNLDDLMDGVIESKEEEPIEKKKPTIVKPKVDLPKIDIDPDATFCTNIDRPDIDESLKKFENNIINYVENSCKELTNSFLSELRINLENQNPLDDIISKFIKNVRTNINDIVEEYAQQKFVPDRSYDFDFYFDELANVLKTNNEEKFDQQLSNFDISELILAKSAFVDKSQQLLDQIKAEKPQTKSNYREIDCLQEKMYNIQAKNSMMEKIIDFLDKQIHSVRSKQTTLRSRFNDINAFQDDFEMKDPEQNSLTSQIEDLIYDIKNNHQLSLEKGRYSSVKRKIKDIDDSIKTSSFELQMQLNRIASIYTIDNSYPPENSFAPYQCQQPSNHIYPTSHGFNPSLTYQSNHRAKNTDSKNQIVSDVRSRLKHVQQFRMENNSFVSNM